VVYQVHVRCFQFVIATESRLIITDLTLIKKIKNKGVEEAHP